VGEYNASAHFLSGKLGVSLPPSTALLDARVIAATQELPEEFPYQTDMNAGNPIGVGWAQSTIAAGQRTYSATAYLGGEVLERKNLDVLVHAHVTQLLVNGKEKGMPIFRNVEFVSNITGWFNFVSHVSHF
jgi:choline dehydrogenase-like flavoprotein